MNLNKFVFGFLIGLCLAACGSKQTTLELQALTGPAITVQITSNVCPSVEVQAGMQVAWINMDSADHALLIEQRDAQGMVTDVFGTSLLQPGTTFSTTLMDAGQYTYYCSEDKKQSGTINVLAGE